MAGIGEIRATCSLPRSIYYNPRHAWGLPDEMDEFIAKEVAENTQNEDDLHNMLWPIQVFNGFYWIRLVRKKVDHLLEGWTLHTTYELM